MAFTPYEPILVKCEIETLAKNLQALISASRLCRSIYVIGGCFQQKYEKHQDFLDRLKSWSYFGKHSMKHLFS